ncbi:methyltransferase domain-containing protein [Salipaludibacillus sp. CUR1]|uniref:putative RNA methyltransferase n=1 Tax=Salipaludibacillus sp. CUR1 TaxID=2820003 RepID=UPI001E61B24F|nr:methyltransferase domain-containing protein [Salipaludibacillus sp. CUR1]MCE7793951.1 methyltransferase domain-containing protein [Salipaludibacillus sp. CUR1]
MNKVTKRRRRTDYARYFEDVFKCPVCGEDMKVTDSCQLVCNRNHSFDFAKQGYVNLLPKHVKTKYTKDLFEARKSLMTEESFFKPVTDKIAGIIGKYGFGEKVNLLDMGCGEGSHLTAVRKAVKEASGAEIMGAGVDLAKEGILEAAKQEDDLLWAVADLVNTPFKDGKFDVLLNILSPSNYEEFKRLMKNDGLVIKVVPGGNYLKELRYALFEEKHKHSYSNTDTVNRFAEHFTVVERWPVSYTVNLANRSASWLVKMTPLAWEACEDRIEAFLKHKEINMTVDVEIIVGKKHE